MTGSESMVGALRQCSVSTFRCLDVEVRFLVAPTLFPPDDWTETLLVGLEKCFDRGTRLRAVAEVGVGLGIVPMFLTIGMGHDIAFYTGLDINSVACEVARINLALNCPLLTYRLVVGDIFDQGTLSQGAGFDLIVANLPQMLAGEVGNLDRNSYYFVEGRQGARGDETVIDDFGLRLIQKVLSFACERLSPEKGVAVFTLSGRCGDRPMQTLLKSAEVEWLIIHSARLAWISTERYSANTCPV